MSPRFANLDSCKKHGFIVTCFVNGKKRFRAVCLRSLPAGDLIDGSAAVGDPASPNPTTIVQATSRRRAC